MKAIQDLVAYSGGLGSLKDTEFGVLIPRMIHANWLVSKILRGVWVSGKQVSSIQEHIGDLDVDAVVELTGKAFTCENPFTCPDGKFTRLRGVQACQSETLRLLCEIRDFTSIIIETSHDISGDVAQHLRSLKSRLLKYPAPKRQNMSHTGNVHESCRLTSLLLVLMATSGIVRRYKQPGDASDDSIDSLLKALYRSIRATDVSDLWGELKSILLWISCVAVVLSQGMLEYAFFKALFLRNFIYYGASAEYGPILVRTMHALIDYQDACESGRWIRILHIEK